MMLRAIAGAVIGAVAGLLLSMASRRAGGGWTILCSPVIASLYGAVIGLALALGGGRR